MSSVIAVKHLSKKYIIGHQKQERYTALRDVLANVAKRFTHKLCHPFAASDVDPAHEEFWALKDVSFDIQQGDRVGIIGRNGAGKSTLLKILSRITEPTSGKVSIKGRVASLLEVGTGFHPELTGRENIFLNGAILGMSKAEIKKKFDEIVAFAEVEKFLDTPVKHYSSGMYVRLAFAVAAHLEPEILILDEILAVGDTQFQKKCLGKMEDVGKEGRTVLFVSHNMQAVQAICNKSIWLHVGQLLLQGDTQVVMHEYLGSSKILAGDNGEILDRIWDDPKLAPGNEKVRICRIHVVPDIDNFNGLITVKVPIRIEFYYRLSVPVESYIFAMHFRNISGELIFITGSAHENVKPGEYKSTGYIPGDFLNNGIYTIELYFVKDVSNVLFNAKDLMVFEVHDAVRESGWLGEFPGAIRPKLRWELEPIESRSGGN